MVFLVCFPINISMKQVHLTHFHKEMRKIMRNRWRIVGGCGTFISYSGVKSMFMGEYQHTVDTKGRLIVPSKFREHLGDGFVLTRGLDNCLFGYPLEEWQRLEEKLKALPVTKKDARAFARFFFSGATEVELDKQGRINIPSSLLTYAKVEKECVVVGVSSRIEIWSKPLWDAYYTESEQSFNEIAENIIDFDF